MALAALTLAGCPPSGSNGDPDGGHVFCEIREDCSGGQVCTQDNVCVDCQTSGECRLKEECRILDADAGVQRCELRAGWGADCERNDQCLAGSWCVQGLCKDSSDVRLCPSGSRDECAPPDRCNAVNFVCEQDLGCSTHGDCSPGEACRVGTNECVPRCTAETEAQVCAGAERCVNEICVQCVNDSECGVGLFCDRAGRCVAREICYQNRDCRVPQVCHVPTGECRDKPPDCRSDENCAPDERCNVGTGRCVPRACQADRFEPNNDVTTARAVGIGTLHTDLTLCSADVDLYAFSLSRGDRLGVTLYADPFAEDTFTTLIQDSTGRTVASGRLSASYVASTPATYYVSVSSTDTFQMYDAHFLNTRDTPCDDDTLEPNDLPQQGTPVNVAGEIGGVVCPQDQDHFLVGVPSGKSLRVSLVDYLSSSGLLRLCVSQGGVDIGCSDDPGTPVVSAASSQVGGKTALVRVNAPDERTDNSYTLKVEFL